MKQGIFYGILYVEVIMLIGTVGLELFADPLVGLFAMSQETEGLCVMATKIIAIGFLFAGGNIAMQGVFQALGCGLDSLVVSLLRLLVVVLPLAWLFARLENASFMIWWSFPIAELVAFVAAAWFLWRADRRILKPMEDKEAFAIGRQCAGGRNVCRTDCQAGEEMAGGRRPARQNINMAER